MKKNTDITRFLFRLLLVALVASSFAPSASATASEATQAAIDKICRSMEDYQFCNQTFNNNLPAPDVDAVGLTKITIDQAQRNATNTLTFIQQQIPITTDPAQLNHYKVCENAYTVLKNSFDQAAQAFGRGDYRGMADAERDTPRAQASCETIFSVPPKTENPLNERNREMRILLTMAVVTGSQIVT